MKFPTTLSRDKVPQKNSSEVTGSNADKRRMTSLLIGCSSCSLSRSVGYTGKPCTPARLGTYRLFPALVLEIGMICSSREKLHHDARG